MLHARIWGSSCEHSPRDLPACFWMMIFRGKKQSVWITDRGGKRGEEGGRLSKLEENQYRSSTFLVQSLQEAALQIKLFSSFHILVRIRRFLSRWRVGRGREEETREEGNDCNVTTRSKTRSKTDWRVFLMDAIWCYRTAVFLSVWKERKHRFEEITCFSGAPVSIGKMEMRAALLRLPVCWRSLIVTHTHGASSGSPFHCASIWEKDV